MNTRTPTKRLAVNAMMAAMCAVLGFIALDLGNIKITFETLPIHIGALLFGPVDGMAVGAIGTLIYQLLKYGVSVTTVLWMLPYIICGLVVGLWAKKRSFSVGDKEMIVLIVLSELMITALNTGVMYIDSKIYGYYSFAYIFGSLLVSIIVCVVKAVAYGFVLPPLLKTICKAMKISQTQKED